MREPRGFPVAIVRIPAPLRPSAGGAAEIQVASRTVREALEEIGRAHEGFLARVLDEDGGQRRFVNLFVGSKDVRQLSGLETRLADGDVVSILPAVAGGAR